MDEDTDDNEILPIPEKLEEMSMETDVLTSESLPNELMETEEGDEDEITSSADESMKGENDTGDEGELTTDDLMETDEGEDDSTVDEVIRTYEQEVRSVSDESMNGKIDDEPEVLVADRPMRDATLPHLQQVSSRSMASVRTRSMMDDHMTPSWSGVIL